jgi:hypothetical protein
MNQRLYRAHRAEANRLTVTFTSFGWVAEDDEICSKTSEGFLTSKSTTGVIMHSFEPYDPDWSIYRSNGIPLDSRGDD